MNPFTDDKSFEKYLTYFNRDAQVEQEGKVYRATETDFKALNRGMNYWHSNTSPSTWLSSATVVHFKHKFKEKLPRSKIIELCAQVLNTDPGQLEQGLDWNANYMAWHEGGSPDFYHPYPREAEE